MPADGAFADAEIGGCIADTKLKVQTFGDPLGEKMVGVLHGPEGSAVPRLQLRLERPELIAVAAAGFFEMDFEPRAILEAIVARLPQ